MNNINYFGMRTIVFMKLKIFLKEYHYSIISPIISSLIFIIILGTINEFYNLNFAKSNYMHFLIPGIIIMIVIQEAYSNISETLIHMKQMGSFNDILMSPISRTEIAISFIIGSLFISIIVCMINIIVINIFFEIHFYNFWRFLFYISITSIIMACFGSIIGFISYTWDVQQSFFNFCITPISLLSGSFFSINLFDNEWKFLFLYNPFFYLVSNFRKSFSIDQYYSFNIDFILLIFCFLSIYLALFIFKKGYKVIN